MKKYIYSIIGLFLVAAFFPMKVFAAGGVSVSPSSISMNVGESKTFTVTATNAAGRVDVSSNSGNVSVSPSTSWVENGSVTFTVTGNSQGSGVVTVTVVDVATFDGEDLSGQTRAVNVTVNKPAAPDPTPTPDPTPKPDPKPPVSPKTSGDEKSGNNDLKSITAEGYTFEKVDDTHYKLTVRHSVESIDIKATPDHAKATVTGAGKIALKEGENTVELVVTAENGNKKTYTIVITRKDNQYTLKDLDDALNDGDDVSVSIVEKDVVTKDMLTKIKNKRKLVRFTRYNEEKKSLFSWLVDGKKLKPTADLQSDVSFKFTNEEEFDSLADYRKGLYVQLNQKTAIPGVTLEVPAEDLFKGNDTAHLYGYDSSKKEIKLVDEEVKIKNGKVEIELGDLSQYFVTKATIGSKSKGGLFTKILLALILAGLVVLCIILTKNNKKEPEVVAVQEDVPVITSTDEPVETLSY